MSHPALRIAISACKYVAGNEGDLVNLNSGMECTGIDNNGVPWNFQAKMVFNNTGHLTFTAVGNDTEIPSTFTQWIIGRPNTVEAALYEMRVTQTSALGSATRNGTVGAGWIDCATADSNRTWEILNTSAGDAGWVLQVTIRNKISMVEYADEEITLTTRDDIS